MWNTHQGKKAYLWCYYLECPQPVSFLLFSGFPFCRLFHINVFAASNPFVGRVFRLLFYYVSVPNFLSLFLLVLLVSVGLPTFGIQCHACFCVIIQVALHCRVGTLYLSPFRCMRNKMERINEIICLLATFVMKSNLSYMVF